MPEFTVKEVRLPELHLPEIKRDEIVRSLSGVHLPEVDLAKARRTSITIPTVSLSSSDVGKLLAAAVTVVRFVRPAPARTPWLAGTLRRRSRSPITRIVQPRRRRSRWPIALGGILVVVLGAWAVLRRPEVRLRVDAAARDARARFDELRDGHGNAAMEVHEPVAMIATEVTATEGTAAEVEGAARASTDAAMAPAGTGMPSNPSFDETSTPG